MKKSILIFNAVVVSILSLAPTAWAQIVWTNSSSASVSVYDYILQNDGQSATYSGNVNVAAYVQPYVTSVNGQVYALSATISANLTANNNVGNPAGVPVVFFGTGGTVGNANAPFISSVSIAPPDYFYGVNSTYSVPFFDYDQGKLVTASFGVNGGPLGLSITPNQSDPISVTPTSPGANGEINLGDALTGPAGDSRYVGVFANQNYLDLQNFWINEGAGGGELGTITLKIPVSIARAWWDVVPLLDGVIQSQTATVTVQYVRANAVTNLIPTVAVSATASSIKVGGVTTLNVTVKNNSQAVGIGPFSINLSSSSLQTVLSCPNTLLQNLTVGPGGTLTTNFTLTGNNPGIVTPQLTVSGNWGWPIAALGLTFSVPGALNGNITTLVPVTVQCDPSGRSFTVDGTPYTTAQNLNWVPGATHTISTIQTQSGGTGTQYVFGNWSDSGYISHTVSPTSSTTYIADFTTQYYLTMNAGTGGSVGQNSQWLNNGQVFSISASPSSDYSFNNWTGSGLGSYSGPNSSASVTMNGPITETANFTIQQYTVSVSASPSADGTATGSGIFTSGSSVTVTATANTGYQFANWTENGIVVSSSASYNFTLTENVNLIANFTTTGNYTVSVSASPSADGTATGGGTFASSSPVTVTATANTGYQFVNWTENGTVVSSSASYNFILSGNLNLIANFMPINYTVSVSASPSADGTATGDGTFAYGSPVTVAATANTGYQFVNWMENGGVVSSSASYAFTVSGNVSLVANFTVVTQPLTNSSPQITNVVFSGSPGSYTITVKGAGLGSLSGSLPFTNVTPNFSIVDFPNIGLGAESGYTGDAIALIYQSWVDTQIQVSGFRGQPGDAITIAIWNPTTGAGATWGGNVPGGLGTLPQITSVDFAGSGTNLQIRIFGSGFGNAPTHLPFAGDVSQFIFQDHFTHSGAGSFESGGNRWGHGSPDSVTLKYQSWSDNQIVINGFTGAYGQGNNVLQNGDPATIVLWNTSDASQNGPQTAWGGFVSESPLLVGSMSTNTFIVNAFGPAGSNCVFQASTDLRTWVSIYTNPISSSGSWQFIVPATNSCCFFRSFIQ